MAKIKIETYRVGEIMTNCYFVINEETKEMFVIDPGASPEKLAEKIREKERKPVAILLTHGHFDHVLGAAALKESLQVPIYAFIKEKEFLENAKYNSAGFGGMGVKDLQVDTYLEDEEILELAGFTIKVLFTPGHTPGGCCYYLEKEKVLFSGDTLFLLSVGRTDFPGGDGRQLIQSIREKLMTLPDDTIVLPGHDDSTTIEQERRSNPYL